MIEWKVSVRVRAGTGVRIANDRAGLLERGNDVLASIAEPWIQDRLKREMVSTAVRTRIFLPVASWS